MVKNHQGVPRVIEPASVIEGAGVKLLRSFGPSRENPLDPFLLFDHFGFNDPIEGPMVGFPQHPHRGIETVTYMLEGNTRHRDSLGNVGLIGPGDVQWMTSGRGILHEEMPRRGPSGRVNGFQLWVNLPAAQKMDPPRYQEIDSGSIPVAEHDGVSARVIAGSYAGQIGPVTEIAARPLYMDVRVEPGHDFSIAIEHSHTAAAYVFEGAGIFGAFEAGDSEYVESIHMVVFDEGGQVSVQAGSASHVRFLLFAGRPFREPIVPYGPFVMNTEQEIRQAISDLRSGNFVDVNAFAN